MIGKWMIGKWMIGKRQFELSDGFVAERTAPIALRGCLSSATLGWV
jgi:hypothetical protein